MRAECRDHIPSAPVCQTAGRPLDGFPWQELGTVGRSLARAAKVPGLGAEPLIQLCVPLCCAVLCCAGSPTLGQVQEPPAVPVLCPHPDGTRDAGTVLPRPASVPVYPCPGAAGRQRYQSTGTQPGMGQGRVRRSLGLFLVTLGAPGHNIPARCHPLPARRWPCSPWGRIVTLGTRLGTALSCTPQTPATPEERFSWLLIELHCHRKPRSRSSLEPPVSH